MNANKSTLTTAIQNRTREWLQDSRARLTRKLSKTGHRTTLLQGNRKIGRDIRVVLMRKILTNRVRET